MAELEAWLTRRLLRGMYENQRVTRCQFFRDSIISVIQISDSQQHSVIPKTKFL